MKQAVFKDRVKFCARAGDGGNGCVSFRRERCIPKGGPDGGDGGHGGSVVLRCDENEDSLLPIYYQPFRRVRHAQHGMGSNRHGRNSEDCIVEVSPGTAVTDVATSECLGELLVGGDEMVVAKGGRGGIGNARFKSSTNQCPSRFTEGTKGEERMVWLELKLISDVGLVGYPNAGKSTLLGKLTHAHPKVSSYPFTTVNPIAGTLKLENFSRLKIADIPGLLDGAHMGIGLGHQFLRHIERASFLLFVIDMAGTDGRTPVSDFLHLREELRLYMETLVCKPCLVLANKMDLPRADIFLEEFKRRTGEEVLEISAELGEGLEPVRKHLYAHFF